MIIPLALTVIGLGYLALHHWVTAGRITHDCPRREP